MNQNMYVILCVCVLCPFILRREGYGIVTLPVINWNNNNVIVIYRKMMREVDEKLVINE